MVDPRNNPAVGGDKDEAERREFEAWAASKGYHLNRMVNARGIDWGYQLDSLQYLWQGWQAARAQSQQADRATTWKAGYKAGFLASGEGWNGEYPFQDCGRDPEDDGPWLQKRDAALAAEQGKY